MIQNIHGIKVRYLALFGLFALTGCGGGDDGSTAATSSSPSATASTPQIESFSPTSIPAGSPELKLTITGSGFAAGAKVSFNYHVLPTHVVADTKIMVEIPASELNDPGPARIVVTNPGLAGRSDEDLSFEVGEYAQPVPESMTPALSNAGASGFTLTLTGAGFSTVSTVTWDGNPLPTTFVSTSELRAEVPADAVDTIGTGLVSVTTPALPLPLISKPLLFKIGYTSRVVMQLANEMVWDPDAQVIYLSVPNTATSHPGTISALDPVNGTIKASKIVGSKPNALARAADGSYLYVGFDDSASITRFTLPSLDMDITIPLGTDPILNKPYRAFNIAVAPGAPQTIAVSFKIDGAGLEGPLAIFDDATARPEKGGAGDFLEWNATADAIYSADGGSTAASFFRNTVDSKGIRLDQAYFHALLPFRNRIHYAAATKLVYSDAGTVVDPVTGSPVAAFPAFGRMTPAPDLNEAFFIGPTIDQLGTPYYTVMSFDLTHFTPIAAIVIGPIDVAFPKRIIRWGSDGLAINTGGGKIFLIRGDFVKPTTEERSTARLLPELVKPYTVPVTETGSVRR